MSGAPAVVPHVHLYEGPGGRALTSDLGAVGEGVKWSTALPGGFRDAVFTVRAIDLPLGVPPFCHVEIRDQTGALLWEGRAGTAEWKGAYCNFRAEGYFFGQLRDDWFQSTASGARTPVTAIKEVVGSVDTLVHWNAVSLVDHGSFTVDLAEQQFQRIRPRDFLEWISALGDADGNLYDVAVWDRRILYYQPRDDSSADLALDPVNSVLTLAPDTESLWNGVIVEYKAADGSVAVTAEAVDNASREKYNVVRRQVLKENDLDAAQADSLAQTYLTAHSGLRTRLAFDPLKTILDARGGPLPTGMVRAGQVLYVPNAGNQVITETDYDATNGELTLDVAYGWTKPSFPKRIDGIQQQQRATALGLSATTKTPSDRDAARTTHTHTTIGNNVTVSGDVKANNFRDAGGALWKSAVIEMADGSFTRYACLEMERTMFGVKVPLGRLERCLPLPLLARRLNERLPYRFLATVQGPLWVVRASRGAFVFAEARGPYQMPAFGGNTAPRPFERFAPHKGGA